MTAPPRVAVTGFGVVTAWGWGVDAFRDGLLSGETAIGPFGRIDSAEHATHVAAQVPDPPPGLRGRFRAQRWDRLSLSDRFALAAAAEALDAAGLAPGFGGRRAGVFFASSTGGMIESEDYYRRLRGLDEGPAALRLLASQQVSGPCEAVARAFGVTGPTETVSSACASGALALSDAWTAVRSGEVDVALAGGADSLCRTTYGGFNSLRSVDPAPCRPFRKGRAGLSLGEGGAVLVLEPLEAALERGARPRAILAGAGASGDAHHMTAPDPAGRGAARAIGEALDAAGLDRAAIAFVNAHGTGTPLNDAAEWQALRAVFGAEAGRVPLTSTKASIGHLLGAAGAVEAVATLLALEQAAVPPTPGAGEVDPEAPVRLVAGGPLALDAPRAALSINLGFGGCNGAVAFVRCDDGGGDAAEPQVAAAAARARR